MGERVVGIGGDLLQGAPRGGFNAIAGDARCLDVFPPGVRRGILQWIASAKKPETDARRVEDTARLAARNIRANQWRPSS
jgi:uncharacterized protein YdeI (YjbR/CyaY-like superfamily)